MSRLALRLSTLDQLDFGVIDEAFRRELELCVQDCGDRPNIGNARKLTVQFELVPVDRDGDDLAVEVAFRVTLPPKRTKPYHMRRQANGSLTFAPLSPDNHDQESFLEGESK